MSDTNKQVIQFTNKPSPVVAFSSFGAKAVDIIQSMEIASSQAIIFFIGSAGDIDQTLVPRLTQLYGVGIAKATGKAKALILDGGTQAGVMQVLGEAVEM